MVKVCFNECSQKAFAKIPPSLQGFILEVQEGIQRAVLQQFPGAYPTSGFRCGCENRRCGGMAHSLHLVGMARDFGGIPAGLRIVIPGLKVVPEPQNKIYHFEVSSA